MAGVVFKASFDSLTISQSYTLPKYLPSMRNGNQDRNYLIKEYFRLGFNYTEILFFLALYHGVHLSLRHLKKILVSQGLCRKKIQSRVERVVDAIDQELQSRGSCIWYRQMYQHLLKDHRLLIDRETDQHLVKGLDPEGVELRSRNQFKRRKYVAAGPNFTWHLDGYDNYLAFVFTVPSIDTANTYDGLKLAPPIMTQ